MSRSTSRMLNTLVHQLAMSSSEQNNMSFDDKVQLIEREIRMLHKFCTESGFTPRQIESSAEIFFRRRNEEERGGWGSYKFLLITSVLAALLGCLLYVDPVYRAVHMVSRVGAIKLLPLWDWTQVAEWECLIDNPLYEEFHLVEDDCEVCKDLQTIERVSGLNHTEFINSYLKPELPVIVEDGLSGWPENLKGMSVASLSQAYWDHPVLEVFEPCSFHQASSIKTQSLKMLLHKARYNQLSWYTAHWENCVREAAKAFRGLYKRPYFLPRMVEISDTNWVFLSKGLTSQAELLPIQHPLVILMQIKGQTKVTLRPREPCKKLCTDQNVILKQGEVLVVTVAEILWDKYYTSASPGENIAIGVGGAFD